MRNKINYFYFADQKKKLKEVEELLIGNRPTINRYMKCRKRRVSARQLEKKKLQVTETERGSFSPLPVEVTRFYAIPHDDMHHIMFELFFCYSSNLWGIIL